MHHRKSESGRGRSRKTTTREALEAGCRTALAQKSTPSNSHGKVSACAKDEKPVALSQRLLTGGSLGVVGLDVCPHASMPTR
jgi:hypothetical protein